jgi:hypothetical protein
MENVHDAISPMFIIPQRLAEVIAAQKAAKKAATSMDMIRACDDEILHAQVLLALFDDFISKITA